MSKCHRYKTIALECTSWGLKIESRTSDRTQKCCFKGSEGFRNEETTMHCPKKARPAFVFSETRTAGCIGIDLGNSPCSFKICNRLSESNDCKGSSWRGCKGSFDLQIRLGTNPRDSVIAASSKSSRGKCCTCHMSSDGRELVSLVFLMLILLDLVPFQLILQLFLSTG